MVVLSRHYLLQALLASIFVGLSLQYTSFHGYRTSNYGSSSYGSSSSNGLNDPWFIGISCALLGLLFITLLIIFVRYIVQRKQARRHSTVQEIDAPSRIPDNMAGQNPYVMEGYRPPSAPNGWSTPTPNHPWDDKHEGNKWHGALDQSPPYEELHPTIQNGFTQPGVQSSTFVPAFSYGTQFSNTPPQQQNERPITAPLSTIYGPR